MRIFGYFKSHPLSAAYIDAVLSFRGYYDRITFLIDTGATRTSILDSDAKRIGIELSDLEKSKKGVAGIGGIAQAFVANKPTLIFTSDGKEVEIELDAVYILKHKKFDDWTKILPSLLARDVLNRYHFVYDYNQKEVYLTDE